MDKYTLPTSVKLGNHICEFNSDFRDVLNIFNILSEPNLLQEEKIIIALENFYKSNSYIDYIEDAIKFMFEFINGGELEDNNTVSSKPPLYSWEQDFTLIVAPINRVIGKDVRGMEYLHWWTFLSAFMEIGECTFNTYVGIRDKLNRGKKLESWEEKIFKENRDKIILKKKYDDTTQDMINDILGI